MTAGSGPMRIAIVNDYEVVVAGVAAMLAAFHDRIEIVEQDSRLQVLRDVDLVLFDTFAHTAGRGPGLSDLVRPDGPKVVLFTWTADPRLIEDAMGQGAAGYLSKTLAPIELVGALEDIHAGRRTICASREPAVDDHGSGDWPGRELHLSPRESEVLALIARGLTNNEIAKALYLSVNSVKTHIRSAYRKIGVQRRSQAVGWALEHGFTDDPRRSFPDLS